MITINPYGTFVAEQTFGRRGEQNAAIYKQFGQNFNL